MTNRPEPPRPARPPSPTSYPRLRRRRSSRSPSLTRSSSSGNTSSTCLECKEKPSVKVYPCMHSSNCENCFDQHLKSSDKCPVCNRKIDSCYPQKNTWGKCKKCNQFSKLILVEPCNHSVICTKCFYQHVESNGNCPHCEKPIDKCDLVSDKLGKCRICNEFRLLATFMPCGHASICQVHSKMYVDYNGDKCTDCGKRIAEIL
ncbi:uncharacterized protein TNCT_104801 [Trichonephila clavata]|uniref:RING-type domain-containing protein n=1 Tax=Trichonephila clavata TaxID=2740835 RepID=A0A8X6F7E9_TRICU|nr:uncharacterized protein TNCT_104801 [Trichonephila clavata]